MAETIESFVAKLQAEGVQAGEAAAREIRAQAEREAEEIANRARQEAEKIVTDARREGERILSRAKTELELAARDAVLRLRESLNRVLHAIVADGASSKLADAEFLGGVLHDLVMVYAQRDCQGKTDIRVDVSPEMQTKLVNWAMSEMRQGLVAPSGVSVDLKGSLAEAGFEYTVGGATVEVTTDSVAAVLRELVGPELRNVIDRALAGEKA